jgi:hypothetical protein
MTVSFTDEELHILDLALYEREGLMYSDFQKYMKNDNADAADDCFSEMKKAHELRMRLLREKRQ